LAVALKACTGGLYPLEASVALPINLNRTFLRRHNFTSRFIATGDQH
jgi:hypothetical protein